MFKRGVLFVGALVFLMLFSVNFVSAEVVKDSIGINMSQNTDPAYAGSDVYIWVGMWVQAKNNIQLISFSISELSTQTHCFARDMTNGNIYEGNLSNHNCSFATYPEFENQTLILLYTNHSAGENRYYGGNYNGFSPFNGTNIEWLASSIYNPQTPPEDNYTVHAFEIENVWTQVVSQSSQNQSWTENLNNNLWGYFTFNESEDTNVPNVFDGIYNGTLFNTEDADWTTWLFGNSIKLDGVNEFINFTDPVFGSEDFTISWWENRTSADCTYSPASWGYVKQTIPQPLQIWCAGGTDLIVASSSNGASWDIIAPDGSLNCGQVSTGVTYWALTRIGNTWTCYKNAIASDSIIASGTLWNSQTNLLFGTVQSGQYYNGSVDEIGIWKSRGLNSSEVSQLYNNGNGITYMVNISSQPNTTGFWTLNGTNLYPSNLSYKVGIGTSSPTTALEVIGSILASSDVCITGVCLSDLTNFANFALINAINTFTSKQIFDDGIVVNGDANFSTIYLNGRDISKALPGIINVMENISTSSTTLSNITGLNFNAVAGEYYHFRFIIPFRSSVAGTGLKLSLSVPDSSVFSAKAHIPRATDGVGAEFQGWITSSDDTVTATGVQSANTDYLATIEGVIKPTTDGIVQAKFASETTNTITIREGSIEFLYQI